ncbi:MAG: ribosome assembly factor SBDS [Candidatus Woesearchaeota archaeon]
MRGGPTYEKERVSLNVARLKKGGENFEVVVDPDKAVEYKETTTTELREVLRAPEIYADANKGELASEEHMKAVFETENKEAIAKIILEKGEIQLTAEHRERIRENKRNKLVHIIHINAINPQTGVVHPQERIKNALQEARFRIDEFRTAEDHVQEALKALRPIIPITFTTFIADIHLPSEYAGKCYATLTKYGTLQQEQWLNDGTLAAKVELPAGRYNDLVDELASKTHGTVEITKIEKK